MLERRRSAAGFLETPGYVWLACAGLVWVSWALGGSMVIAALGDGKKSAAPADVALGSLREHALVALGAGAGGIVALLVVLGALRMRAAGGKWRPTWRDLGVGAGALLLAAPFVMLAGFLGSVAHALVTGRAPEGTAHTTLGLLFDEPVEGADRLWWVATVMAAAVIAPVIEEFVYRGFLQSAALRWLRNGWAAVLLTSLVFTAAHYGATSIHAMGGLFAFSVALGVVRERTGSVWACVVMHAGFNGANLLAASLGA